MKKVDNTVANNTCDNVFFTKSSSYAKSIPLHGVNSLQPERARLPGCDRQVSAAGCWTPDRQPALGRCPCGRDVPVVRHVSRRDPVSNITLAVGVALLLCGLATALLGVYGYLLKGSSQFYIGSAAISGTVVFWTGVSGILTARRFGSNTVVRGFLAISTLGLLASIGLIIIGHLGARRHSGLLVDVLGGGQVCLGVINVILLVIGMVASACCRMTPRELEQRRRLYLNGAPLYS
ncbi:hypothetical protein FJT64_011348 [Amphibalanus amphitrite]|uniref:Uncharacterized protein n=1 Tax=Amphibalanus amphitrite TaxID=1232801 RepID=A0A6A4VJ05_AMPAM|nr:hypothetical protein FJT64_011348 [Amphibalanus amphitrite]